MEKRIIPSDRITPAHETIRHITAFSAVKQEYGLQIKVAGCVTLKPARSKSENVIGIVELDDQVVPILDGRKDLSLPITDLSCIVLFENQIGRTTIITGRLYESACQVFDLIVECMDNPQAHEHLYTIPTNHFVTETAE
ncbi:MAG: hypothetical protein ACYTET_01790 [Planctomycetota bacterium]|jgi:hypothetical protein